MSSEFFQTYVFPAYEDWKSDPSNIRLAKILASDLNNIAEHYWNLVHETDPLKVGSTQSVKDYRDYLTNQLYEFGLIRDIADSHKHLFLSRASAHIESENDATVDTIGFGKAYGLRWGGGDIISLKLKSGETVYFDVLADKVYEYWKSIFNERYLGSE